MSKPAWASIVTWEPLPLLIGQEEDQSRVTHVADLHLPDRQLMAFRLANGGYEVHFGGGVMTEDWEQLDAEIVAERDRQAGAALQRLDEAAGTAWSLRKINGSYEVWLRGVPCGVSASLPEAVSGALGGA